MPENLKCTCYRLRKADRRVTRLYEAALADCEITIVQFSVLAELQQYGACGVSELAAGLGTERTTMTRTLERMQALGWLEGVEADDSRLRLHRLTDAGHAVFRRGVASWRRVESAMARGMGAERLALLWQLLGEAETAAQQASGDLQAVGAKAV